MPIHKTAQSLKRQDIAKISENQNTKHALQIIYDYNNDTEDGMMVPAANDVTRCISYMYYTF